MTVTEEKPGRRRRRALIGAVAGAVLIVAGVIGLAMAGFPGGDEVPMEPTAPAAPSPSVPATEPRPTESDVVVEPDTSEKGWMVEPETSDPREYAAAAVEAAYSYDSTASTRDEFRDYLMEWFDLSPEAVTPEQVEAVEENLGQSLDGVLLDISEWDQQRLAETRQVATVESERMVVDGEHSDGGPAEEQLDLGMHLVSVPVRILYDEVDISTGEAVQYDYRLIQTVRVVCGNEGIPTDGSMAPGSCKLIAFRAEPAA